MATAEQVKSLIKAHFENNIDRFLTTALQVAAHEARQGHSSLAHDIRSLVDQSKSKASLKVIPFNRELEDLFLAANPQTHLSELIVPATINKGIKRILREYRQQTKLKKHGLDNRRKLLLTGPPGTGKTMTATVLAGELHLPLFTILMDKLVTKFMGETSAKLRQIFNIIRDRRAIFLFDEFDAIGAERGLDNDVGEMRRVLNSFLQFIESDNSDSLIIAATNNPSILDQALFRRFDDVLHYKLPNAKEIEQLITNRLASFKKQKLSLQSATKYAVSLSHAEITQACDNAIKETVLNNVKKVNAILLREMLKDRKAVYGKK